MFEANEQSSQRQLQVDRSAEVAELSLEERLPDPLAATRLSTRNSSTFFTSAMHTYPTSSPLPCRTLDPGRPVIGTPTTGVFAGGGRR